MAYETYSYDEILEAYRGAGVEAGRIVYVTGNFGRPGLYHAAGKSELLDAHFSALRELVGPDGTIVVPTHSWSLCNTSLLFDPLSTPSETGPFTEYVRQRPSAVRQFHPFGSHTALGREADALCSNNSRHVFGVHSPFQRMIDKNALYVSVGQEMENSISIVHHVELVMGVPYRYSKEFVQPCRVDGKISDETFYVFVTRNECEIKRNGNVKLMAHFKERYVVRRVGLGRSFVEALSMKDFFWSATNLLKRDIYAWLSEPPSTRPYRN